MPEVLARARELARDLLRIPSSTLAAAKALIKIQGQSTLTDGLALERVHFALLMRNEPQARVRAGDFLAQKGDINEFIDALRRRSA